MPEPLGVFHFNLNLSNVSCALYLLNCLCQDPNVCLRVRDKSDGESHMVTNRAVMGN